MRWRQRVSSLMCVRACVFNTHSWPCGVFFSPCAAIWSSVDILTSLWSRRRRGVPFVLGRPTETPFTPFNYIYSQNAPGSSSCSLATQRQRPLIFCHLFEVGERVSRLSLLVANTGRPGRKRFLAITRRSPKRWHPITAVTFINTEINTRQPVDCLAIAW